MFYKIFQKNVATTWKLKFSRISIILLHLSLFLNRRYSRQKIRGITEVLLSHVVAVLKVLWCCGRKARAAWALSSTLWQQVTIEIMRRNHAIIASSRQIHMVLILRAHPVRGESHIQCNANREVATKATGLWPRPEAFDTATRRNGSRDSITGFPNRRFLLFWSQEI